MRLIFVIKFYGGGIVIGRERSRQIQSVRGNAAFSFLFVNVKKAKRLKMDGRLNFNIEKWCTRNYMAVKRRFRMHRFSIEATFSSHINRTIV